MSTTPSEPALDISRELEVEALLAEAQAEAEAKDIGDEAFIEPLGRLLSTAVDEARLNFWGVMAWKLSVKNSLVNRLRMVRDIAEHPEILEEDVSQPIIILGLPRTGTTKLQRMMSADPGVQRLLTWRLLNPAPFPGTPPEGPDPRIAIAKAYEQEIRRSAPDVMAGHPIEAEQAEEETFLMEANFESLILAIRLRVPSYQAWVWERSPRPTYDYLRTQLQYLQWQDGGRRKRPWIMKSPLHLGNVDTLVETFPGATIVHCHRDPAVVIPSMARLTEAYRRTQSDAVDLVEIGLTHLDIWSKEMERYLTKRDQDGGDRIRVLDVDYSDIVQDPLTVVRRVYECAERALTPEAVLSMEEHATENPQFRSGSHSYSLEQYGLTAEQVAARFTNYKSRFLEGAK